MIVIPSHTNGLRHGRQDNEMSRHDKSINTYDASRVSWASISLPLAGELLQTNYIKVPLGIVLQHLPQLDRNADVIQARQQRSRIQLAVRGFQGGLVGTPSNVARLLLPLFDQ